MEIPLGHDLPVNKCRSCGMSFALLGILIPDEENQDVGIQASSQVGVEHSPLFCPYCGQKAAVQIDETPECCILCGNSCAPETRKEAHAGVFTHCPKKWNKK